jgi:hypothetical protein
VANPDDLTRNWTAKYNTSNTFAYNGASFSSGTTDRDPAFNKSLPDMVNFCLACHDNTLPSGVTYGTTPKNIAEVYATTSEKHGRGDGSGTADGGDKGSLKAPYTSTSPPYAALNCTDCHDPHGEEGNIYHLKNPVVVNGTTMSVTAGSAIVTNTRYGNNGDFNSGWCTFCHSGITGHGGSWSRDCGTCHRHGSYF